MVDGTLHLRIRSAKKNWRKKMTKLTVTSLSIYPVKGCQAIQLDRMDIVNTGPLYDRQWMIVDASGKFISQRTHPKLAVIVTRVCGGLLEISIPNHNPIVVTPTDTGNITEATLHGTNIKTVEQSTEASRLLSDYLECDAKLVGFAKDTTRAVNPTYALPEGSQTLFSDAFPFLMISEESLEDLNTLLESPLLMTRFRPNIVIKGVEPYGEDHLKSFRIGEVVFSVAKPCTRCTVTTVDQDTGIKGKEPLLTLARYRNTEKGILFGANLVHNGSGVIKLGDVVERTY